MHLIGIEPTHAAPEATAPVSYTHLVFFLTFTVGDFLKGFFEVGLDWLSGSTLYFLQNIHASEWITSLVVDGIVAGVGGILTFLPNIFILFLALAFLEDSGYMARVAYVMNETMGRVGLSGKAFLPMLLGFGCTVPAVMAARACLLYTSSAKFMRGTGAAEESSFWIRGMSAVPIMVSRGAKIFIGSIINSFYRKIAFRIFAGMICEARFAPYY